MRHARWLLPLVGGVVLCGCQSPPASRAQVVSYATLRDLPTRQTERARDLNRRAVELVRAGDVDSAETLLKEALTADVAFGPAHNNLGKVYFHQRRFYLAAWEFRYAMGLMPGEAEPKNNLGLVYEVVGKLDDAVDTYAEANALQPDSPDYLGNLARARVRRGDRDEQVRRLLSDLLLKETRPDWVERAQMELVRMDRE